MSQGLIQGSMREAPLPDIIQLVSQGGKSGCFHVTDEPKRAKLFLKDGRLVHAVSHDREGLDAVYEVALWLDGRYMFEEGDFSVESTITKPNPAILMEMHRRMDEWRVISQKIRSLELYPASTLLPGEQVKGVHPKQARMLGLMTGWYSAYELAEVIQKPVLNIAKDLYDLVMAGYVVMKGVRSGRKPEIPAEFQPTPKPQSQASKDPFGQSGPLAGIPGMPASAPPAPLPFVSVPPAPALDISIAPLSQTGVTMPTATSFPGINEDAPTLVAPPITTAVPEVLAPPRVAPRVPSVAVPSPGNYLDPGKVARLVAFAQRIRQTAEQALPSSYFDMVERMTTDSIVRIQQGEGPEVVKNLALSISRTAVESGCDGDTVKALNAGLKSLFAKS